MTSFNGIGVQFLDAQLDCNPKMEKIPMFARVSRMSKNDFFWRKFNRFNGRFGLNATLLQRMGMGQSNRLLILRPDRRNPLNKWWNRHEIPLGGRLDLWKMSIIVESFASRMLRYYLMTEGYIRPFIGELKIRPNNYRSKK